MKPINLEIFSPVTQISHPLFDEKQVSVFLKRDDLIHPIISGNKWRKLKYILQKARAENKNHLVTFGGAYSNHLLATAAAAAMFGFKTTGFVRGEAVDNNHLFLCRLYGMELLFMDRESYRDKLTLFNTHFGDNADVFFIDEGGASAEAAKGCAELISELPHMYDHLFCACGTGTTAAGILNGIVQNGLSTHLHAIPVLKGGGFMAGEIDKYVTRPVPYSLHLDYHFGGYAKTTPQLIGFIREFIAQTGILIDPVYTGKMLYAIFDLIGKYHFAPGSKILGIHTGGTWGLLGMAGQFSASKK